MPIPQNVDLRYYAEMVGKLAEVSTWTQYQEFLKREGFYDPESRTVIANYPVVKYTEKAGVDRIEDCFGNAARCESRAAEIQKEGKNAWVEWLPRGYTYAEMVWNDMGKDGYERPVHSLSTYAPQPEKVSYDYVICRPFSDGFPITAEERDAYLAAFAGGASSATIRDHTYDRVYPIVPHDEWVMLENDRRMDRERRV